jgi:hypothetical protein
LGFAIDLIYGSGSDPASPEYWWAEAENFDLSSTNPAYNFRLRNVGFDATFDKAIFLEIGKQGSCLHVMDEVYRDSALMAQDTRTALLLQSFANTKRINLAEPGVTLPAEIFGEEPAHTWCYYFQKADLARQQGDWQGVISLYQAAFEQGYKIENGSESLPLVIAYLHTGQWSQAADETIRASDLTLYNNDPGLCLAWQNFSEKSAGTPQVLQPGFSEQKQRVDLELVCKPD